jgi:hypothetical protein
VARPFAQEESVEHAIRLSPEVLLRHRVLVKTAQITKDFEIVDA